MKDIYCGRRHYRPKCNASAGEIRQMVAIMINNRCYTPSCGIDKILIEKYLAQLRGMVSVSPTAVSMSVTAECAKAMRWVDAKWLTITFTDPAIVVRYEIADEDLSSWLKLIHPEPEETVEIELTTAAGKSCTLVVSPDAPPALTADGIATHTLSSKDLAVAGAAIIARHIEFRDEE